MDEKRAAPRARTLRSAKILFNNKHSVIDCMVRNLSSTGARLQVTNTSGVPDTFELLIEGEERPIWCDTEWQADRSLGVSFRQVRKEAERRAVPPDSNDISEPGKSDLIRSELLRLRAAFDVIEIGVVLLDHELRAQFINAAFRKMWHLSDEKANSKPAFVALMYHGRDTLAYEVSVSELDRYVADRVAHVKSANPDPLDIRLAHGRVLRLQCAVLPDGGRMLCYTDVSDIVRRSKELEVLHEGLEHVQHGVLLLDADLRVQFANRPLRDYWGVAPSALQSAPLFADLLRNTIATEAYGLAPDEIEQFVATRMGAVMAADPQVIDLTLKSGSTIRSQCVRLPGGRRMLTYHDVSDLFDEARKQERFANRDALTGLSNRRHFLEAAEGAWHGLQRYQRPLSLMMLDLDRFKHVNDQFGHETGDQVLKHVASLFASEIRATDLLARYGGEEFVILLA